VAAPELRKIMLVEDDPDIQVVAEMALGAVGGYEVKMCSDGREALAAVDDYAPDLILLDVMMPDMDGPTTFGELRRRPERADTPVIFMTAKVQPDEVHGYQQLGALGVIAKPFDPMTLASEIEALWRRAYE